MNIEEILNSVDRKKVSVIMQVNLQNYKDSREDAIGKFIRAVESFKAQLYNNSELIIVSDGCKKTHQLYSRSYANDKNIKFVYYDRRADEPEMYSTMEGDPEEYKYYRGFARRVGVGVATGELITYMDSDDVLAPEFTMTVMLVYNQDPSKDWWINNTWYDHSSADFEESKTMYSVKDTPEIELSYVDETWKQVKMKPGMFTMSPWLLVHKSNLNVHWRDVYGTMSEDSDFNRRLREAYPNGALFSNPIYARCHFANKWDI
jgi:glycosyltransferase involved in cell wall biosynthesis